MFDRACNMHCVLKEKRIKGSLPEWINSDYIELSKDRDYYYSKAHKTNNPHDWLMAGKLRNQANKLNKNLKKHYCNNTINENTRDEKFKYLGVLFDQQLSWDDHVNYLFSNISKRIGVICRVKYYLPSKTVNMLAQALVFPHFGYCSSVWSNISLHHINEL